MPKGSHAKVDVKCDCEDCEKPYLKPMIWYNYLKCVKDDGKYYCNKCAKKLYGNEKYKKTRLKNSKSFEDWCISNNRQDILDLWDYELNDKKPDEICFATHNNYYFKCSKGIHKSELKKLSRITSGHNIICEQCNSFEQWCIDNNRLDILYRWDYNLNKDKPNEISYSTGCKKYFKCSKGIHESELKHIDSFVHGQEGSMNCKQCNSFAQYLIDLYGDNALDLYWDYENNIIDPWEISYSSGKKVYIKCQEKDYHGSYPVSCDSFSGQGSRCAYCINKNGKVHPLDSLGTLFPQVLDLWSDKNKKSSYEYSPYSKQQVWWKCPDEKHSDYPRSILNSNRYNFRCPECQYSKGEEVISNYFISKGFIKIDQDDFKQLTDKNKDYYYIPQKEFKGLIGLKGGLLSYDFYLPKLNLLIEYQGNYHDGTVPNQTEEEYKYQLEHDKRKCEYAMNNNIKLLEIWYWDFDKIEQILDSILIK